MEQIVRLVSTAVAATGIPFADGEDFSAEPLTRIMGKVTKGGEILLELTSGLRDAVMQLLLASRALSFGGIPTAGAVYGNFGTKEIVDCSDRLTAALIPVFRAKFGQRLNVPSVIRWCINSDMLQQTLTLYRERIPGYLLERSTLPAKEEAGPPSEQERWVTEETRVFRHSF